MHLIYEGPIKWFIVLYNNRLDLGNFSYIKVQIGVHAYKVVAFKDMQYCGQFNFSLRPTGDDNKLPVFLPEGFQYPVFDTIAQWLLESKDGQSVLPGFYPQVSQDIDSPTEAILRSLKRG